MGGSADLGLVDIIRAEQDLALQVGQADMVRVDEGQRADASGSQVERSGRSQPARADNGDMRP